jgi:hypothetical protein
MALVASWLYLLKTSVDREAVAAGLEAVQEKREEAGTIYGVDLEQGLNREMSNDTR